MSARTLLSLLVAGVALPAGATIPYTPIALPPGANPGIGPGLIAPKDTFGKEYSHDTDSRLSAPAASPTRSRSSPGTGSAEQPTASTTPARVRATRLRTKSTRSPTTATRSSVASAKTEPT